MWRVEPLQVTSTQRQPLTVAQSARWSIGKVVERCQDAYFRAEGCCLWRGSQELIHCSELISFEMRAADPAKVFNRHNALDSFQCGREQLPQAGVEQQRLLVGDQVGVESESPR